MAVIDEAATDAETKKVARLKQKTDAAKTRLASLKDRQRHKNRVEREQ